MGPVFNYFCVSAVSGGSNIDSSTTPITGSTFVGSSAMSASSD
jgi:hypothetical protein